MLKKFYQFEIVLLMALLGSSFVSKVGATSIEKLNLSQLVKKSGRIIVGKCIDRHETTLFAAGGEIPITVYTFSVSQSLKGDAGGTLELRQFGSFDTRGRGNALLKIVGMPDYKIGEEFVLILTAESKLGLSVPVGLGQGCFRISQNKETGVREVLNGFNNAGLFDKMAAASFGGQALNANLKNILTQKKGNIQFDSFITILENLPK